MKNFFSIGPVFLAIFCSIKAYAYSGFVVTSPESPVNNMEAHGLGVTLRAFGEWQDDQLFRFFIAPVGGSFEEVRASVNNSDFTLQDDFEFGEHTKRFVVEGFEDLTASGPYTLRIALSNFTTMLPFPPFITLFNDVQIVDVMVNVVALNPPGNFCGCNSITIANAGAPSPEFASFFAPGAALGNHPSAPGAPPAAPRGLGPLNAGGNGDLATGYAFEVIATLESGSIPELCPEGQWVKSSRKQANDEVEFPYQIVDATGKIIEAGKIFKSNTKVYQKLINKAAKLGNTFRIGSRTSDGDWIDDGYHKNQVSTPAEKTTKVYSGMQILWLDAPGYAAGELNAAALANTSLFPMTLKFDFEHHVNGVNGGKSCSCNTTLTYGIDNQGNVTNPVMSGCSNVPGVILN